MARLVERLRARRELEDIAVYIGRRRPSAARPFLAAARKTYDTVAARPAVVSNWKPEDPRFEGLRYFPITRYPTYVIFYRPLPDGVEVLHVLHGARDLEGIVEAAAEDDAD